MPPFFVQRTRGRFLRRSTALVEVVDPQQNQRPDQRHDEASGLAFLVPADEPAMPISMVIQIPPGSLPGIMSLASAPTTNPMSAVQRRLSIHTPSDRYEAVVIAREKPMDRSRSLVRLRSDCTSRCQPATARTC